MLRISACKRRRAVTVGVVTCAAMFPSAATAASQGQHYAYKVSVNQDVLVSGSTVPAAATVRNPDQRVKSWWGTTSVATVVRNGVDGRYQMPYDSRGYRCAPVVKGNTANFTCKLRGADVPTSITLTYAVQYSNR